MTETPLDAGLMPIVDALRPVFPDLGQAEVERVVYELVYAALLAFARYAEETTDVSWGKPQAELHYPGGWDWEADKLDLNPPRDLDSWIEHPDRHVKALVMGDNYNSPLTTIGFPES